MRLSPSKVPASIERRRELAESVEVAKTSGGHSINWSWQVVPLVARHALEAQDVRGGDTSGDVDGLRGRPAPRPTPLVPQLDQHGERSFGAKGTQPFLQDVDATVGVDVTRNENRGSASCPDTQSIDTGWTSSFASKM